MHLTEVLVAGMVFLGAACSSLQIWAASAAGVQQWDQRRDALERSEQERVLLQVQWRQAIPAGLSCPQASDAMRTLAEQAPHSEVLERTASLASDGRSVTLHWRWSGSNQHGWQRQRLITPEALGLCDPSQEVTS